MSHTLLVWECVPEETKLYLIPDAHVEGFRQHLEEAHNKYFNQDDECDGMSFVNMAISNESSPEGFPFGEHEGVWKDFVYKIEDGPLTGVLITSVYITGFIM